MSLLSDIDDILNHWKRANPHVCHTLGIHDFDGEITILTENWIKNRIDELILDLENLSKLEPKYRENKLERFECNLVRMTLEKELFELRDRQEYRENPLIYIYPLRVVEGSYTKRSFASIDNRIRITIKFEKQIPKLFSSAKILLKESIAKVKILMAIDFLKGIINFFKKDLRSFITQTSDSAIISEWESVNTKAIESMNDFLNILNEEYRPKAHMNFALGKNHFMELLEKQEGVKTDFDNLLKVGKSDLEKNYSALKNIIDEKGQEYFNQVTNESPDLDKLFDYATSTLDRARQFVLDSNIASVPTDEQCKVIPTPEFIRKFAFAAMNTPGPFEVPEASEAFYYVTPPDGNWPESVKKNFLKFFNKSFFELVTVHEAWPGHYLQLLWNKQAKSTISKFFARSTSMIEGWAHYCEEMVIEEQYAKLTSLDETKLKIGQLLGALVRNCRYVAAIKMHCMKMTVDQAKDLFITKAFMPEQNAQIEANRGTIDPMYLNYTLGKLLIKKLRQDYKEQMGNDYSLRRFHDTLLSYGSPPIITLREILLNDSSIISEIL